MYTYARFIAHILIKYSLRNFKIYMPHKGDTHKYGWLFFQKARKTVNHQGALCLSLLISIISMGA